MKEVLRTTDPVLLSYLVDVLAGENIEAAVLDVHTSVFAGSVEVLPRRVMVHDEDFDRARRMVMAAEERARSRP